MYYLKIRYPIFGLWEEISSNDSSIVLNFFVNFRTIYWQALVNQSRFAESVGLLLLKEEFDN